MTNAELILKIETVDYNSDLPTCIGNQRLEVNAHIFDTISGDNFREWFALGEDFRVIDAYIIDTISGEILCDNIGAVEIMDIEDFACIASEIDYLNKDDIHKANALFIDVPSYNYLDALARVHEWELYGDIDNEEDLGEHLYHEWNFGDELRKLPELLQDAITIDFDYIAEQYMANCEDFISDYGWMRHR